MINNESNTLINIHKAGKKEFLEKGYQNASLRQIVKNAGVTTGAFYGYYSGKIQLFNALVADKAKELANIYCTIPSDIIIADVDKINKENLHESIIELLMEGTYRLLEYIYKYKDEFILITSKSAGTEYENYIDLLSELKLQALNNHIDRLNELGNNIDKSDMQFEKVIITGMLAAVFKLLTMEVPYNIALEDTKKLYRLYRKGWGIIEKQE